MVSNFRTKAILATLLMVGSIVIIFAQPITLGLDLAGGTYLRYSVANEIGRIDPSQRPAALESLMEILRSRVDNLGIKETTIRSQGEDEIIVELPGSSEAEAVGVEKVIE